MYRLSEISYSFKMSWRGRSGIEGNSANEVVRGGEKRLMLCSKLPWSIFNNCSETVTYNEKCMNLMFIAVSGPELLKLLEFPKC